MTVYLFFVRVDSAAGSYSLNPFELINPRIKSAYIEVEGTKYPTQGYNIPPPYSPSANQAQCREPYLELYRILAQTNGMTCGLTYDQFLNQFHVIAFQISGNTFSL